MMACNIFFTIFALLALVFSSYATPISSSSTCTIPTVTTGGNKLIGYVQATATPGTTNYFPSQNFSDYHMIGGTAYSPTVVDRSIAEWSCQYSCGQNCFAFFVFWNTTPGNDAHFECRVYTGPFAQSDLVSSPKAEWTRGQGFNKQCYGPAMKFKRVAAASIELSTGGSLSATPLTTSAGPFPTSTSSSTKTSTATKTVTVTLSSLATPLSTSTVVSTIYSSASSSSSLTYTPTTTSSYASTCGYSAVAPTATIENVAVDPAFYPGNLISMSYLAAAVTSSSDAIKKCAAACDADPKCAAFIVTEVTKPDGTKQWTCDLYQRVLGPGQLIPAPPNKHLGAVFNNLCPATTAAATSTA